MLYHMDTSEQVSGAETPALKWELSPIAVEGVRVLLALLETEYAGLKEQYDAVEKANGGDSQEFDPDLHVYWWLDDIRDAIDSMEDVNATPDVDENDMPEPPDKAEAEADVELRHETQEEFHTRRAAERAPWDPAAFDEAHKTAEAGVLRTIKHHASGTADD